MMKRLVTFIAAACFALPAYALPTTIDVLDATSSTVTVPTLQAVIDTIDDGIPARGLTAADSAITGAPVTIGGYGSAATPTAMSANGDVTNLWLTLEGAAVVAGPGLDDAAYGPATTRPFVAGAVFDDSGTDSVNEGDAGYIRMSANRNAFTTIRDAAGNERGANVNASNQLVISCGDCVGGGAVDAAAPSSVTVLGYAANGSSASGTLDTQRLIGCTNSAVISTASSGNVEIVPLTAGETIYICGWQIVATGAVAVQWVYGTSSACSGSETNLTGAMPIAANGILTYAMPFYQGLKTDVANALCIELGGAVQVDGVVFYTKA
jgi:hypothetical protein